MQTAEGPRALSAAPDHSARPGNGGRAFAAALLAGTLLGSLPGCSSPDVVEQPIDPRPAGTYVGDLLPVRRAAPADMLTALADDGSLAAGLNDASPEVRLVATRGLGRLPSDNAGMALMARLDRETDDLVLAEVCFALGQWGSANAAPGLAATLDHPAAPVRAAAVEALGKTHDDSYTSIVVDKLLDSDANVRGAAALALFRFDGRRYEHERSVGDGTLGRRDQALAEAALQDAEPGVRWRATYTLANIRGRGGLHTILDLCLNDRESLSRVFAARGLGELAGEGFGDIDALDILIDDEQELVAIEAAAATAEVGSMQRAIQVARDHRSHHVRRVVVEALGERVDDASPERGDVLAMLADVAVGDPSPTVQRSALEALVKVAEDRGALVALGTSPDPRSRAAAATLLAEQQIQDDGLLSRLLQDEQAVVRVAALPALGQERFFGRARVLVNSLAIDDPAVRTGAAQAAKPHVEAGRAEPALMLALVDALETSTTPDTVEARQALQDALGVPRSNRIAPPAAQGRLLERLVARHRAASVDPRPRVRLDTSRGPVTLELFREDAPLHVASFLELAGSNFYDELDLHRVVPNFVVQGLDPRADGWGTGGRRLPDEFNRVHYVAGTLGMPNAGEPHTGGCQIFITHLPTPHLDGGYTAFGRVVEGFDVLARFEVGDVITEVSRVDGIPLQTDTDEGSSDDED